MEEIVALVQRENYSAMISEEELAHSSKAPEDQHKTWHKKTSNNTWHQKTSTDLAQEALQTEKKPPDNTMAGLTGGTDPGRNMGGQDHVLHVGDQILTPTSGVNGSAAEVKASEDNATLDNDGGGEVLEHQEDHDKDDDRKTGKTAAECKAFCKACRICNEVHHLIPVCDERHTNIVVITSDDEDERNVTKTYEM
jgi:hypothetical protein